MTQVINNEEFVADLLDCVPVAHHPTLLRALYEECLSRYDKVLKAHIESDEFLSSFVTIHHSETYFIRGTWGEDSALDGGQLPVAMYYWNKFKQIASAHIGFHKGYNFVESALHDVLSRHGLDGAISFIQRAWSEKVIICDDHAWFPWWLLIRCRIFSIDYSDSQEEYLQAVTATESALGGDSDKRLGMYQVAQDVGKIDQEKGRSNEGLIQYYWALRRSAEHSLGLVRGFSTYSSWMSGIRNLLPQYLVLNVLADEAQFCATSEESRQDIIPLSRFVDERQADIKTSLGFPSSSLEYHDIVSGEDQRSKIRRLKFYNLARVISPTFVFEKLRNMIMKNNVDLSALESSIIESLRPGHRWFMEKNKELLDKVVKEVAASSKSG